MIMGASLKIMGGSDRVCKKPCDEDGTCANVRLKVPDYTVEGTLPNGRYSKLKEIKAKCSQVGLVKKHSICSHCMGPGSNCQYDTDCASGWCMGNGYGAFQGTCTDMGRLAGAPCARDNECKSKNCRRGVRSYGVCALTSGPVIGQSGAATGLPECEKATGRLPGCNCAKSSQCASNFCDGSIVDLALERGACKFTPRPVLATCHAAKTCGDCTGTAAHGVFGVHACVWSIGKVQDQSEIWPGEENEIVVTRREEGCYAAKKSQNWEEQRYIDTAHSSMCAKKDEVTLPRAAKIKHCSEIKAADGCLKCVNQDVAAGLVLKTGTEECVWSIGAPIAGEKGHENWDHLMSKGGKKFGSKEVSRKSGANGGPRCVRRKPSTKSWIMNRYIDRAHKDLCAKQPTPALVEDQGANEAEKCADLTHTGRDAESKCKLCTQNPLCKEGIFTKSSFMSLGNKCRCEAKDEVVQPGWKRDM